MLIDRNNSQWRKVERMTSGAETLKNTTNSTVTLNKHIELRG